MNVAKFEVLGIEIPIGKYETYHDDGHVSNVLGVAEEISRRKLDFSHYNEQEWSTRPNAAALCLSGARWPPSRIKEVHVFYNYGENEVEEFFMRGYAETEALRIFGELSELEIKLKREGFRLKKGLSWLTNDSGSKIGGIYATLKEGYSPENIRNVLGWKSSHNLVIKTKVDAFAERWFKSQLREGLSFLLGNPVSYNFIPNFNEYIWKDGN